MTRIARVAVVGGGLSGLMCAVKLKQLGLDAVVFDTGKHAVGGRCSSRDAEAGGRAYLLDHSVQCFTAASERFARVVGHWRAEGLVEEWAPDKVGTLRLEPPSTAAGAGAAGAGAPEPGRFTPRGPHELPLFYCPARGMRGLSEFLAASVTVQRPVWVGRLEQRAAPEGAGGGSRGGGGGSCGGWDLYGPRGRHLGVFDYVVIAHNGKCADQLMSTAGVPAVHNLLRVRFCAEPMPQQQVMQLCSLWVVLVGFASPLPVAWQGAFVEGSPVLSWAANNTAKITANRQTNGSNGGKGGGGGGPPLEFWTLISTREFGAQHKVPQENIPPAKAREVTGLMLEAFAAALGLQAVAAGAGGAGVGGPPQLRPAFSRVQLWGAAVPLNVLTSAADEGPCVLDAASHVGICGDWLHSPCVEGACLSGLALAEAIQENWLGRSSRSIGLGPPRFRVVAAEPGSAPIGSFAGASNDNGNGNGHQPRQPSHQGQQAPKPQPRPQPHPHVRRPQQQPQQQHRRPSTPAETSSQSQPTQDWPQLQPQTRPQPQTQPQQGRPLSAQQGWIRPPSGAAASARSSGQVPAHPSPAPPPPSRQQQPQHQTQSQQIRSCQQRPAQQLDARHGPAAAAGDAGGRDRDGGGSEQGKPAAARLTAPAAASRNARRRAAKRAQAAGAGGTGDDAGGNGGGGA